MKLKNLFRRLKNVYFFIIFISCFFVSSKVYAETYDTGATEAQVLEHEKNIGTGPLARLTSGFVNIVTAPLELVDKPREELKKTNPVYSIVPGAFKGVGWAGARMSVGIWEVATFYLRHDEQPQLEPMDLDWLTV
jgi:putative exosortase-associated protein (TIGR04073 family)